MNIKKVSSHIGDNSSSDVPASRSLSTLEDVKSFLSTLNGLPTEKIPDTIREQIVADCIADNSIKESDSEAFKETLKKGSTLPPSPYSRELWRFRLNQLASNPELITRFRLDRPGEATSLFETFFTYPAQKGSRGSCYLSAFMCNLWANDPEDYLSLAAGCLDPSPGVNFRILGRHTRRITVPANDDKTHHSQILYALANFAEETKYGTRRHKLWQLLNKAVPEAEKFPAQMRGPFIDMIEIKFDGNKHIITLPTEEDFYKALPKPLQNTADSANLRQLFEAEANALQASPVGGNIDYIKMLTTDDSLAERAYDLDASGCQRLFDNLAALPCNSLVIAKAVGFHRTTPTAERFGHVFNLLAGLNYSSCLESGPLLPIGLSNWPAESGGLPEVGLLTSKYQLVAFNRENEKKEWPSLLGDITLGIKIYFYTFNLAKQKED